MKTLEQKGPDAPTRRRLTVDDLLRMDQAGLFDPEERVELIDGEMIDMATIGSRHASVVKRLNSALSAAAGNRAIVSVQDPLHLGEYSLPQPDLVLCKPRADFYAGAHPTAADTLLVIEVADTSARFDREIKLPLYARHAVPEVWIVDLDAGVVRFFRRRQGDAYADITATQTPGPTAVGALEGVTIDLSGVLG